MSSTAAEPWDALEADARLLAWYVASGVDECILDAPIDRLARDIGAENTVAEAPGAAPIAGSPAAAPAPRSRPASPRLPSPDDLARAAEEVAARAQSLGELEQAIRAFEGCALKKTAMNTVFAAGNPASPLMLVGDAPGADEDRQGQPFVGESGQLLDRILAAIGRDRSTTYLTNILPWRPPGNRKPTPQEAAIAMAFMRRHIALAKPRLLVFLGGTAASTLLETNTGIMRLRGRWSEYGGAIPAMATFHPDDLMKHPHLKRDSWRDFLEIAARLDGMEETENSHGQTTAPDRA